MEQKPEDEAAEHACRHFQKEITARLQSKSRYNPEARIRPKFDRWKFGGFPGRTARTFQASLNRLRKLAPPRVIAATLAQVGTGGAPKDGSKVVVALPYVVN